MSHWRAIGPSDNGEVTQQARGQALAIDEKMTVPVPVSTGLNLIPQDCVFWH